MKEHEYNPAQIHRGSCLQVYHFWIVKMIFYGKNR